MKRLLTLALIALFTVTLKAQDRTVDSLDNLARSASNQKEAARINKIISDYCAKKGEKSIAAKNYEIAAAYYESAFRYAPDLRGSLNDLYNAACAWALAGKPDNAFLNLDKACDNGFVNVSMMRDDPDLRSLHGDERWTILVGKIEKLRQAGGEAYQWGIFFGILITLCLYNLFLFLSIRDIAFLYYAIFIFLGIVVQAYLVPGFSMYTNRLLPWLREFSFMHNPFTFFLGIMMVFFALFVQKFLGLKANAKRASRVMLWLTAYFAANALVSVFNFHLPGIFFSPYPILIGTLIIFAIGIISWRRGNRSAKYFVIANAALTLGFTLSILDILNITRTNLHLGVLTIDQVGFAGFLILLSFALGDRINTLKMETITAQQKALAVLEEKVQERTREVVKQKEVIEIKNLEITDSITYAKRIQQSILPPFDEVQACLPHVFILFKPKDIVSGDFYWFQEKQGGALIAAADCTGHGVPGAIMSMLGSEKLAEAAASSSDVSDILSQLNRGVKKALRQSKEDATRDGMDIALLKFTLEKTGAVVDYSGANRPLCIIRKDRLELEETKATKMAIGGLTPDDQQFKKHTFNLQKGDTVYIFTDGYADQFSPQDKKLMTRKFKEVLLSIQDKSMEEQKDYLNMYIENWKGNMEQTDDILVIGIRT